MGAGSGGGDGLHWQTLDERENRDETQCEDRHETHDVCLQVSRAARIGVDATSQRVGEGRTAHEPGSVRDYVEPSGALAAELAFDAV